MTKKVVDIASRRKSGPAPALTVVRKPSCFCAFSLDEKTRTVSCKRCERSWDAFEALLYVARNWTNYAANLAALKHAVARHQQERDQLRKDIHNLKAQAKRARGTP